MAGDVLLHNFLLLLGNEKYARDLADVAAPMPPLRSVADVVCELEENTDAMADLVVEVTTMTRVDRRLNEYWRHVALLVASVMHETLSGGSNGVHPNVAEDVTALVASCPDPSALYVLCQDPKAKGQGFFEEVRAQVGYRIASNWLDAFHSERRPKYDATVAKFRLNEMRKIDVTPTDVRDSIDPRLLRGDTQTIALQKAQGLLKLLGASMGDQETILTNAEHVMVGKELSGKSTVKPEYVCRVQSGYEWNRYNATHYDSATDNLPPSITKGYKFDIFYPDLPERLTPESKPTFTLLPTSKGWEDTEAILKFSAGLPYSDIAFRVANRNWNRNPRRGFQCVLERGVFSLYFQFQHVKYRR